MTTSKEKSTMKNMTLCIALILVALVLAACGGGGGGADMQPKTTAILKINLTGILPPATAISGTVFTVTLPADVTPAMSNGAVANGVVMPSGTFDGGILTPPVYTAATSNNPAALCVTLANSVSTGVDQVGEVATITLQLANGVNPTANSFALGALSVIDASLYSPISGMDATIASVVLQ